MAAMLLLNVECFQLLLAVTVASLKNLKTCYELYVGYNMQNKEI